MFPIFHFSAPWKHHCNSGKKSSKEHFFHIFKFFYVEICCGKWFFAMFEIIFRAQKDSGTSKKYYFASKRFNLGFTRFLHCRKSQKFIICLHFQKFSCSIVKHGLLVIWIFRDQKPILFNIEKLTFNVSNDFETSKHFRFWKDHIFPSFYVSAP